MKQTTKNAGTGMTLGMCIGVGVGSVIDSLGIPMGLCFGMLIGLVIGANKDKIVNKQVSKKGYKIKVIEKDEAFVILMTRHLKNQMIKRKINRNLRVPYQRKCRNL